MTPNKRPRFRYMAAHRDGESGIIDAVSIAVQYSRSWDELLGKLRSLTGDPELALGSEWD